MLLYNVSVRLPLVDHGVVSVRVKHKLVFGPHVFDFVEVLLDHVLSVCHLQYFFRSHQTLLEQNDILRTYSLKVNVEHLIEVHLLVYLFLQLRRQLLKVLLLNYLFIRQLADHLGAPDDSV